MCCAIIIAGAGVTANANARRRKTAEGTGRDRTKMVVRAERATTNNGVTVSHSMTRWRAVGVGTEGAPLPRVRTWRRRLTATFSADACDQRRHLDMTAWLATLVILGRDGRR